ncbi:MAG: DUF1189 family protein [Gammaproteobacteria bacterium]|nr:DUF1189 family protein [Gammaproteobacteria bacterium]
MKQYGYLQALVMSFYSRDLYRDVAKNWGGHAAFYLLVLLALCWIPLTIATQVALNAGLHSGKNVAMIDTFVAQVPVLTLNKDGTLSTPEKRPYVIKEPDNKKVIAVIDTTGQYTTIENQPFDILITKTSFIDRKNDGTIEIHQVPKGGDYVLHPDVIVAKVKGWLGYLWIVMFPFFVIGAFIGRLIQALFYALIGKIMSLIANVDLPYFTIYVLTLVSLTPVILISTVLDVLNTISEVNFSHMGLIYFVIAMIYLFFAIYCNKPRTE